MKDKTIKNNQGITLQELLIVITIIVFLVSLLLIGYSTQLHKGRDGKRRADLQKIKLSFEDYFNDNGCYPAQVELEIFETCDSDGFKPWLNSIPCDSLGNPYTVMVEETTCPSWFAVFAEMEYLKDSDTVGNECFSGCAVGEETYNYAVTSDNISVGQVAEGLPTPTLPANCGTSCFELVGADCNSSSGCAVGKDCFASSASCSGLECCDEACRVESCFP